MIPKKELAAIADVAGWLWQRGWAERNAGNLSVRLETFPMAKLKRGRVYDSITVSPALAGRAFLVSCTGSRMRDIARNPGRWCCVVGVPPGEKHVRYLAPRGERPTSELVSHLAAHTALLAEGGKRRAFLHTHPTHLVALSHHPAFSGDGILCRTLWGMMPEIRVSVPRGVTMLPYLVPGSAKLGAATATALSRFDAALWQKHGAVIAATDLREAFDIADLLDKGAEVWLQCKAAGFEPEGLSNGELADLKRAFHLPKG